MSKIGKKIAIVMVLIAVSGLLFVSFYLNYRLKENFNEFLFNERVERIEEVELLIENRFEAGNSWEQIENIIVDLKFTSGFDYIITNSEGNILFSSIQGKRMNMGSDMGSNMGSDMGNLPMGGRNGSANLQSQLENYNKVTLENNNQTFGFLYWKLPPQQNMNNEQGEIFVEKMNRVILITALIIIILTIIISLIFSKYLTVPILKMKHFANKVAEGDFEHSLDIRANDELTDLGNSLNKMTKKLNHLNKIRKKSTSDLAHELRTPLTSMKSYLEAIEDGVLKPDQETITELNEELNRLVQLVNRLASLNDAERKKVYIEKEKIEINELLVNLIQKFNKKAQKESIDIITNLDNENKLTIYTDGESLEIIFNNLISNAIKYNKNGGYIKISSKKEKEFVLIKIKDNGVGIKEKDIPYIFERFYRADSSRSKEIDGTGIGLAVVKELIEALSGRIDVESDESGSIFKIYLPLEK
ncbi:MAG: HAMP domain-containing sensor histidine kinase [Bacillota bacterium]